MLQPLEETKNITFTCQDGYSLTGTLYIPSKGINNNNAIIFAPATGIKRRFYNSLATYLTSLGYGCLTFDNRGIGDSLQGSIKDCKASLVDWGVLDLVSAFTELQTQFPSCKYHIIGHSAGGQLIGLIPNWQDISSVFNIACSSGQISQMKMPYRLKAGLFMNVFIPMSNKIFSYTKSEKIGMGEPLPAQVAQDWSDWCNAQGYVETEFGKRITEHWYYEMDCPIFWLNMTDDDIANKANTKDMMRVFTKMKMDSLVLDPKEENMVEIGHMKFFSSKSQKLWVHLTDWLEKNH